MIYHQGLTAGTLITTPDGDKKIEAVAIGDLVLGGAGEGATQFFHVAKISQSEFHGSLVEIRADCKRTLLLTPHQTCFGYLANDEFGRESVALSAFEHHGDENLCPLHYVNGELFDDLDKAEVAAQRLANERGLKIERIAFFDYDEQLDFRFMPANQLKVNNGVPFVRDENGRWRLESSRIISISSVQYSGAVFNLDVPIARNFAANGILVHDSTL